MPTAEAPTRKTTRSSATAACAPTRRGSGAVPIDANELALLMKALAHPARVEILRYLSNRGTCYFGSLSDVVGLAPSTTSQHVSVLKEAGLIEGSPEDQRTCYCVNTERLAVLKRLVGSL